MDGGCEEGSFSVQSSSENFDLQRVIFVPRVIDMSHNDLLRVRMMDTVQAVAIQTPTLLRMDFR